MGTPDQHIPMMICLLCLALAALIAADEAGVASGSGLDPDGKAMTAGEPDCFVDVRKRKKNHEEPMVCEDIDDLEPTEHTSKCKDIIDKKESIPCCTLRDLCNKENYCKHGKMECFGHMGRNHKCVCNDGYRGRRCNTRETHKTIPCYCNAVVNIRDNCDDVHYKETEQCFAPSTIPKQAACLCNNKKAVDLTKHAGIRRCTDINVPGPDTGSLKDAAIDVSGVVLSLISATTLAIAFCICLHRT